MMHSMPLSSYNMGMFYPQKSTPTINLEDPNPGYPQEIKKFYDPSKMYPYYLMNSSMNPSVNTVNPNINPSMNPPMISQFGMPSHMPNPYMSYPNNSPMTLQYSQMKNVPRGLQTAGIPFGVNPYSTPNGVNGMYQHPYVSPYANMIGGYVQTPPPSFSHMMGLDKSDIASKIPQISGMIQHHNEIQKKMYAQQTNKFQQPQKNDRQKSLPKDLKQAPHPLKMVHNTSNNSSITKLEDSKTKPSATDFLPKKLPFKETKKLSQPNLIYKACPCKGYFEYEDSFNCSMCKNKFHFRCQMLPEKSDQFSISDLACAHCKMRTMDPLNKVEETLGEFYLMNLFEKNFQSSINFKPYDSKCRQKNSKYEIEIRCIRTGQHMKNLEITWPDECQIKINGDKIIDIPALQSNSSLKKRKDYSVFITQNIYSKTAYVNPDFPNVLERMKISLQLKTLTPEEASGKRIRNQFTFALGIYLVEKLNADELYAKIISQEKCEDKNFLKNLMKTNQNEVQIDKITIRLTDPFSWDLIKTPVRGNKCNHAQCFDLKTFISLMLSAKNRTWKCPLCSRDARRFMLDNEQMDLIKKAQEYDPIPKEVSIFRDGKVAFKIEKDSDDEQENVSSVTKTKKIFKQKKQEVIKQK